MLGNKHTHNNYYYFRAAIDSFSVNFHLVQNRLRIDVTPIIAYAGYTHLLARATIVQ